MNQGLGLLGEMYLQDITCIKKEDLRKLNKSVFVLVELDDGKIFINHYTCIISLLVF